MMMIMMMMMMMMMMMCVCVCVCRGEAWASKRVPKMRHHAGTQDMWLISID